MPSFLYTATVRLLAPSLPFLSQTPFIYVSLSFNQSLFPVPPHSSKIFTHRSTLPSSVRTTTASSRINPLFSELFP